MSSHTAARALRILVGFGAFAAVLLFASSPIWRDDLQLRQSNPRGIPLQILSDSATVAAYRSIGYVSTLTSQGPMNTLFAMLCNQEMTSNLEYVARELERSARLTSQVYHTLPTSVFNERVLASEESRRLYARVFQRQTRVNEALFGGKRPSAKIGGMIQQDIDDLARLGLADWAGYDYETYSSYWFAIERDDKGLECLRKARDCYAAIGDLPLASHSADKIGRNLLRMGDWEGSERAILESLSFANAAGEASFTSRALYSLALLRASQGYFAEAESLLVRSVERVRGNADPTVEINGLLGLAGIYVDFGEYSRAGYLAARSVLEIEKNLADPAVASNDNLRFNMTQYLSHALSLQAGIQLAKGEHGAAESTVRRALDVAAKTGDDRLRADLFKKLGDIGAATGRPKDAERCYSDALKIARRKRDRTAEAAYLGALGRLSLDGGRYGKAEGRIAKALDLNPAREQWTQEAELLNLMCRAKSGLRDHEAAKGLCEQAIELLSANISGTSSFSTRNAARGLVDSISSDLVLLESDRFRDCDSLALAAEKWRLLRAGHGARAAAGLDDEIRRCLSHREWIPGNAVVIQHLVTPAKTIVIATDRAGSIYRTIPIAREDLLDEVATFVAAARGPSGRAGDPRGSAARAAGGREGAALEKARSLYRLLIEPVSSRIEGKDVVCFISDDALRGLPFGALIAPGGEPRFFTEGRRIFSSPGLLTLRSGSAAPPGSVRPRAGLYRPAVLVARADLSPLMRRLYPGLDSIPQAQSELAAIRRLIPDARVYTGEEALKDTVTQRMMRAALIHVASHTVQYPVYGGSPALLLSPPGGDAAENVGASVLTAREIAGLDLSGVRLAFISSCESGVGRHGERVQGYGIGGAFLDGGARDVVATRWPVEDASAREFAVVFYEELLRGRVQPSEALSRARGRIIAEDRSAGNPLRRIGVWAPYILIGSFRDAPER